MNPGGEIRYSKTLIVLVLALTATLSVTNAQAPEILSVTPLTAAAGETVTLIGRNFGTTPSALAVNFGDQQASIVSVSDQVLEVTVPTAGLYDYITVTNTTSGLIGYSPLQFLPAYGGQQSITNTSFPGQLDLDASSGLYDLCLCDLDGDGRNDITSVNDNATIISLFRNTSAPGSPTVPYTNGNAMVPSSRQGHNRNRA